MRFTIVMLLLIIFVPTGCGRNNAFKPGDPIHTASLMKMYINSGNYDGFKSLVVKGKADADILNSYNELKTIVGESARLNSYVLLESDSGKMVMVHLIPFKNGKFLIQDVMPVPDKAKGFLKKLENP